MARPANSISVGPAFSLISGLGVAKSPNGELYVQVLGASDALPSGSVVKNGIARTPDGSLCVVMA